MRRGKEYYTQKRQKALELHQQGKSIKKIASQLDVSYSAAYAWIRKGRKPKKGSILKFKSFLEENGPSAPVDIRQKFPKHNEIYHRAVKRGVPIKRKTLPKKYKAYRTWYYLPGQEKRADKKIKELKKKYKKTMRKIFNV